MVSKKLNFNINPAAIKERLAGGGSTSKIKYLKLIKGKKQIVRLVPFKEGNDLGLAVLDGTPILELRQYYGLKDYFPGNYPNIYSPSSFGETDPIMEWYYEYRKENADKLSGDNKDENVVEFLKPVEPKSRYFSFVLVETDAGNELKLWSYAYGTFKTLMEMLSEPDNYGNILDPEDGHSLILKREDNNSTSISVKPNSSSLSDEDIELILNQPSLEGHFRYESAETLQGILDRYLSTDVDVEDEELEDEVSDEELLEDDVESDDTEEEVEEEKPKDSKEELKKLFAQKKKTK